MSESTKKKNTVRTAAGAKPKRSASAPAGTKAKRATGTTAAKAKPSTKPKATVKPAPAKAKPAPAKAKATSAKAKSTTAKPKAPAKKNPAAQKTAVKKTAVKKTTVRKTARRGSAGKHVAENPVAIEANRRRSASKRRGDSDDMFLQKRTERKKKKTGGRPPRKEKALFNALDVCLGIAIAILVALGIHQQAQYLDFLGMRAVVDQQTFYEGTTVEGVDVSRMTLSEALDYWRENVESRYANRAAVLDNGSTFTAEELGYASDYESVLSAAWSAGRNGPLERRYRMVSSRRENPVSYSVTRSDYSEEVLDSYVKMVALQVDEPAVDAGVEDFDAENYKFTFTEARTGRKLDAEALKRSIAQAIAAGGGNVALQIDVLPPEITTEEVTQAYGLIDYAITNANSSSGARKNNIKLAMSMLNGYRVAPGEVFSFNGAVGERTAARGFRKATAFSGGEVTEQIGGGICQVSTTLFNAAVKADMEIVERHNHSLTVSYVDKGKDATVDWGHQDFRFKNTSEDDIFICCYLTNDNRVRFGIFGRLLPNGEKITLEGVTTETIKYETEYQPTPLLAHGQTYVLQPGRNGYKAEAYKIRWDAQGNQMSKELLCKSEYKMKKEIIQYGA